MCETGTHISSLHIFDLAVDNVVMSMNRKNNIHQTSARQRQDLKVKLRAENLARMDVPFHSVELLWQGRLLHLGQPANLWCREGRNNMEQRGTTGT